MARRALSPGERVALRRTVGAYFAFQTFAAGIFFSPVFVVFYQRYGGLDLPAVFALQAFYTAVRVVLDVPLGLLADRFGRRLALAAYAVLTALGCGIVVVHPSLPTLYLTELCFAAGVAAKSGADSALLYDALARFGQSDDYPRIEGRAQSLAALAAAICALASGFLIEWWLPLPYVLTLLTATAALSATVLLDEPPRRRHGESGLGGLARGALGEIARSPAATWLVGLYALLVVLSHVVFYVQQPYFESIGLPVALYGVVFAATKLVHAVIAQRAPQIETRVSPARMPAFLLAAALAPVACMAVIGAPIGALLVPLRGVADGLLQPVVQFYLNRIVTPLRRASVLSIASLVARLAQAIVLGAFGMALARLSTPATLRLAAAGGAIAAIVLLSLPQRLARSARHTPGALGDESEHALRVRSEDR